MSKSTHPDHGDETPVAKGEDWLERNAVRLDFEPVRDAESEAWTRPTEAESVEWHETGPTTRTVQYPDGEEHQVLIVRDGRGPQAYVGACDCQAFEYRGVADGRRECAHLCALARADVVDGVVEQIPSVAERLEERADQDDDRLDEEDDQDAGDEQAATTVTGPEPADGAEPVETTAVETVEPQGSDPENRPVADSSDAKPAKSGSDPFAGALEDVDDAYVMTLGGSPYIRRAGYARLAHSEGYRLDPEEIVGAHETDWSHSKYRVRVLDEAGDVVAADVGTAHADHEDMSDAEAHLDELALTRAATRALAWATGEGLNAVEEVAAEEAQRAR